MRSFHSCRSAAVIGSVLLAAVGGCSGARQIVQPEQRTISLRDISELPKANIPQVPSPRTVSDPQLEVPEKSLSLDEAIRIALENSAVVRVLAGVSAAASGRTIYDPAIANTIIDEERARFDPRLEVNNAFNRIEQPEAFLDPLDPDGAVIGGIRRDDYDFNLGLAKTTTTGGEASLNVSDNLARFKPGIFPLDPQNRSSLTLGFNQPLLQGAGTAANMAPIVVARIETERSFFQFKDSVQELVRGVIEAYWAIVAARTDAWARRQQVDQGRAAFDRAEALQRRGFGSAADVAQARLALANFEAARVGADASVLQREAALRNLIGLPPSDAHRIVPVSPPATHRLDVKWDEIVKLAEELRPDLIELKLIIEADEQLLLLSRNQAQPRLDAIALYRWNGLEGETPQRTEISTGAGQFTDWTLGVNFSVPLGLRQARSTLRRRELIIERDRANLDQGLHNAVHELATNTRNLAQFYEQYEAYKQARIAARTNLNQQLADFQAGRTIFLNVLQAITDWGNAVSFEAQALTQYNTELANLERQTGSILETHGVYFYEERFGSIGPLGRLATKRCYPQSVVPSENTDVYPSTPEPAENAFDLEPPQLHRTPRPINP
jgi:outer membrane protein TolC